MPHKPVEFVCFMPQQPDRVVGAGGGPQEHHLDNRMHGAPQHCAQRLGWRVIYKVPIHADNLVAGPDGLVLAMWHALKDAIDIGHITYRYDQIWLVV